MVDAFAIHQRQGYRSPCSRRRRRERLSFVQRRIRWISASARKKLRSVTKCGAFFGHDIRLLLACLRLIYIVLHHLVFSSIHVVSRALRYCSHRWVYSGTHLVARSGRLGLMTDCAQAARATLWPGWLLIESCARSSFGPRKPPRGDQIMSLHDGEEILFILTGEIEFSDW
jgi:hypothetical protein